MYKQDLVLNNLQWLIWNKTKPINLKKKKKKKSKHFIISNKSYLTLTGTTTSS